MSARLASVSDLQDAARKAACEWLALIDVDKFVESWQQSASLFRSRVPRDRWVDTVRSARAPFGTVRHRSFSGAVYETKLPGAPDGKYVVIRYRTSFEDKEDAVETVTPMLDEDGVWRVSGYFIH